MPVATRLMIPALLIIHVPLIPFPHLVEKEIVGSPVPLISKAVSLDPLVSGFVVSVLGKPVLAVHIVLPTSRLPPTAYSVTRLSALQWAVLDRCINRVLATDRVPVVMRLDMVPALLIITIPENCLDMRVDCRWVAKLPAPIRNIGVPTRQVHESTSRVLVKPFVAVNIVAEFYLEFL